MAPHTEGTLYTQAMLYWQRAKGSTSPVHAGPLVGIRRSSRVASGIANGRWAGRDSGWPQRSDSSSQILSRRLVEPVNSRADEEQFY